MKVQTVAAVACACGMFAAFVQPADAALDPVPVPGGPPIRLRVVQSTPDGVRSSADVVLRRTGITTAVLLRNTDVTPLLVDVDGSLQPDEPAAAARADGLADLLAAINIAHGVTGVASAGNRAGWTAEIPVPARPAPAASGASPAPAPSTAPLMMPMRTLAAATNGEFDIDGGVETTLAAPAGSGAGRSSRSRGGGGFGGGFGGRGGGFGRGGGRGGAPGDGGSPPPGRTPITLYVHVSGRIVHGSLAHMTIAETRSIEIDGLTYTNIASSTIDVVP